jgi:hypothetical protein
LASWLCIVQETPMKAPTYIMTQLHKTRSICRAAGKRENGENTHTSWRLVLFHSQPILPLSVLACLRSPFHPTCGRWLNSPRYRVSRTHGWVESRWDPEDSAGSARLVHDLAGSLLQHSSPLFPTNRAQELRKLPCTLPGHGHGQGQSDRLSSGKRSARRRCAPHKVAQ